MIHFKLTQSSVEKRELNASVEGVHSFRNPDSSLFRVLSSDSFLFRALSLRGVALRNYLKNEVMAWEVQVTNRNLKYLKKCLFSYKNEKIITP